MPTDPQAVMSSVEAIIGAGYLRYVSHFPFFVDVPALACKDWVN
jgi:hypothetical protein